MADSFRDDRGLIEDLLITPLDGVTRIFTKAGAVRGNHVHAQTTQWTYVVSGRLLVVTGDSEYTKRGEYGPGQMACEEPGHPHAWKALEDTVVLVFTKGPRTGEGYENDTRRLKKPLL